MDNELKQILINAEKELIKNLKHNKYIISECDIQALHYSILNAHILNSNYIVSTEWSLKKGKFGKIDLVVSKKWNQSILSNWENRKECYFQITPQYLVEYKNDYAKSLSKKQIDSLWKQVIRINEFAYQNPKLIFRGTAILFHEGEIHENKTLIEEEMKNLNWSPNIDFIYIYFNSKQNFFKIWEQSGNNFKISDK